VSIRSFFTNLVQREQAPTLERAEAAFEAGQMADAAAIFREMTSAGPLKDAAPLS
jgi:thioredoxin-like negative regulator of GroEL